MLSIPCRQLSLIAKQQAPRFVTTGGLWNFRTFANNIGSRTVRPQVKTGAAKSAIRDFLNKEATDAPFAYGKLVAMGGAAVGVGLLCFYGLGLASEPGAIDQSALWPAYVRERIHKTYMYLGGGLGLTAGSAALVFRSPALMNMMTKNSLLALGATIAAMIGTSIACQSIPYTSDKLPVKLLAWAAHCAVMGAVIAPLAFVGGPIVLRAALYTAGIVGGLSATAACAPSDKFLNMGGMLGIGLGVVFAASMGTFFLPPNTMVGAGLYSVALYGGLVLFAAFMLYDTQRLIRKAQTHPNEKLYYGNVAPVTPFDPINAQLSIYANTLNIFIRMVMILSGGGNRRK